MPRSRVPPTIPGGVPATLSPGGADTELRNPFEPGDFGHTAKTPIPNDPVTDWRALLDAHLGVPFTDGNRVDVLRNGKEIFPAMLDAIQSAEETIDFLTFVYWSGSIAVEFAETLARAARRGVQVRVVLDSFGAQTMDRGLVETMEQAGVRVGWFRPIRLFHLHKDSHRTHRKILVCDHRVGFTGGVGIAKEWEGDGEDPDHWRETHFRITGPAVAGLFAGFLANWLETEESEPVPLRPRATTQNEGSSSIQVIRSSAGLAWSDVATTFKTILQGARNRIRLGTPYFMPDEDCLKLMSGAVGRGIDIEILLPGPHIDSRVSALGNCDKMANVLGIGARVYLYQPTMYHAKVMTVDGELACIGSANFNARSMTKDDEIVLNIVDPEVVGVLDLQFDDDFDRCEPVDPARWKQRGFFQRLLEKATRPIQGEL